MNAMCVSCGQELCKNCKGCHNIECERYVDPTESCDLQEEDAQQIQASAKQSKAKQSKAKQSKSASAH